MMHTRNPKATRIAVSAKLGGAARAALSPPQLRFDAPFYAALYPDIAATHGPALQAHFEQTGWREGRDPCPLFSSRHYLATKPELADGDLNPLAHYTAGRWLRQRRVCLSGWGVGGAERCPLWALELVKPFFDAAHYRAQWTDPARVGAENAPAMAAFVAQLSDQDLTAHYLTVGALCGLDPAPDFSTLGYLVRNPDVLRAGLNPLRHYASTGRAEDRVSHLDAPVRARLEAVFDPSHYTAQVQPTLQTLAQSPMAPLVGQPLTLLIDYLRRSSWDSINPAAGFQRADYMSAHSEAAASGLDPLIHYALHGEGRLAARASHGSVPAPRAHMDGATAAQDEESFERDLEAVEPAFDATFYRTENEDLVGDDATLLRHFMEHGWREGRDPSSEFCTKDYMAMYPDIAEQGSNPFLHWVLFGKAEGRLSRKAPPPPAKKRGPARRDADLNNVRGDFNAEFYRLMNPDVQGDDEALLAHYMEHGWREGRDPSPEFSTSYYVERYADIANSGSNPFLHWVLFGRAEGRRALAKGTQRLPVVATARCAPPHLDSVLLRAPEGAATPPATINTAQMDLHWVVPDFTRGGGGHMTIFRMVRLLETFGHRCTIWLERPAFHTDTKTAYDDIVKHFQCVAAQVRFVEDGFWQAQGDVAIATGWTTAYVVEQAQGFAAKAYFVQDHEPEFYPTGTDHLLARETYHFDFATICASPWLKDIMETRYGRWARAFLLAYDQQVYALGDETAHRARLSAPPQTAEKLKIAVYARGHTARRCVGLVFLALEELALQRSDFEVHLFGQDKAPFLAAPFATVFHGVLDAEELAALYRSCHLAISLSGTNYSLVPQEMMACGLPLVELDGGSTQAIFPPGVVTLAGPAPGDIAQKVSALLDAPDQRTQQADAALDWVKGFSWEASAQEVERALQEYIGETVPELAAPPVQVPREVLLDVVVPTYNGRAEFAPVLEALRSQAERDRIQIICVDSSSSDGTGEWLADQPDVLLERIDQKDFQHGRTRNFGASLGRAPFMAFLTQDAQPCHPHWATDILKMFDHFPDGAGLFGRHLPYADHPLYVRHEIQTHFEQFNALPLALSRDTDPEKWASGDQGWRQVLHFYSDNNSAMRRAIWNEIPYPEVDYGEDQVWARDIIEAGHTKLYAPTAAVYHSHDYTPEQTYARAKIEGAFFYTHFGYVLDEGSPDEVSERIAHETLHFELWARRHGVDSAEISMRKDNIAEKYRGWRDGRTKATQACP